MASVKSTRTTAASLWVMAASIAVLISGLAACEQTPPPGAVAPPPPPITQTRDQMAKDVVLLSGVSAQIEQGMNHLYGAAGADPRIAAIARDDVRIFSEQATEEAIKLYAQEFTAEELQAIQAFLSSPAGRSMLAKQPILQERMTAIGTRLGSELQARLLPKLQAAGIAID
jgi:hypothetical protein